MIGILGEFVGDFIVGMLLIGTGRAILSLVAPRRRHGEVAATAAGLAFWLALALLTLLLIWGLSIA